MRKRDELTDPRSCMSRARDDEWTFVLLGRDLAAPAAVRAWIRRRVHLGKNRRNDPQILEAEEWIAAVEAGQGRQATGGPDADEQDCLDLAGAIAGSVEEYHGDCLPDVIVPHLCPLAGEVQRLRAECDRLHDLAGQRALERDSAAQSALTWEAACKEARDERDRLRAEREARRGEQGGVAHE